MIRNIHTQIAQDKGVDIREPSTANFLIDSEDRAGGPYAGGGPSPTDFTNTCAQFTIAKDQSLMNGFFTRLAVQEITFACGMPNVSPRWGNQIIQPTVGPAPGTTLTAIIEEGFYTVEQYLTAAVAALNALPAAIAGNIVFSTVPLAQANGRALRCSVNGNNTAYAFSNQSIFATMLGINAVLS